MFVLWKYFPSFKIGQETLQRPHFRQSGLSLGGGFLPRPFPLGKGRGQHAVIKMEGEGGMSKNLSCDWSTRFMRVILLGLSLVGTNLQYRRTETGLQYQRTAV